MVLVLYAVGAFPLNVQAGMNWGLNIAAVPEPASMALGILAGIFLIVTLARSRPARDRMHRWRVAVVRWINAV